MRYASLKDIDDAGHDIRLWCFACGRTATKDSIIWMVFEERGWPIALDAAAAKFPCKACRSAEHVRILPATRPWRRPTSPIELVAAYFHEMRSAAKKRNRR